MQVAPSMRSPPECAWRAMREQMVCPNPAVRCNLGAAVITHSAIPVLQVGPEATSSTTPSPTTGPPTTTPVTAIELCEPGQSGPNCLACSKDKQSCQDKCQANITCSNHGGCRGRDGSCICCEGWQGNDCSEPIAPTECDGEFAGPACMACTPDSFGLGCNEPCTVNSCSKHGRSCQCICHDGWHGDDCSELSAPPPVLKMKIGLVPTMDEFTPSVQEGALGAISAAAGVDPTKASGAGGAPGGLGRMVALLLMMLGAAGGRVRGSKTGTCKATRKLLFVLLLVVAQAVLVHAQYQCTSDDQV